MINILKIKINTDHFQIFCVVNFKKEKSFSVMCNGQHKNRYIWTKKTKAVYFRKNIPQYVLKGF